MSLRANEIGADVYSTTETKLDKNNLGTQPQELEHQYDYPALGPGKALLDVETGELYEIMHRIVGVTDTVSGLQSESQEYFNWKYRTPEGQDWGGVIQHYYISYAKRQCPTPNTHGEIQTPMTRPDESEITDISPPAFEKSVLFNDDDIARPFLLLERPEVTYEEAMPGETYDILGWYDPSENDAAARVNPTETIAHRFPDIAGVDYTMDISKTISEFGLDVPADELSDSTVVEIAPADDGVSINTNVSAGNFHITPGTAFGESRFLIDSPFDAKDLIKSLSGQPRWEDEETLWAVKQTRNVLVEMIDEFTSNGWTITLDGSVIEAYADTDVDVNADSNVDVSIADIFNYTFTELVEVGTGLSLPGVNVEINADEITTDIVEFRTTDDGVTVSETTERGDNHAVSLTDEKFGFDCEKENAGIVKSLDWKDARYEWNNDHNHWLVNTEVAADLLAAFINDGKAVTAPLSIVTALADEAPITESREVTIDDDAATHLDAYTGPESSVDANDISSLSDESDVDSQTIHGVSVSEADAPSLMALDMKLADTDSGMSVDIGGDLPGLPASVTDQWQPSADGEGAEYGWYHAMTSARVTVQETEGWGTEYDLYVETPDGRDPEHVVTVADERTAALTAMTHLKALTR